MCKHKTHAYIHSHCLFYFYLTYYVGRIGAIKAGGSGQLREPSNGARGCLWDYIFHQMLDAIPRSFEVPVCDARVAAAPNCSLRVHDLMTPRQPIMSSPALYFFAVEDACVRCMVEDWMAKDLYMDAHIFALGCTPHRSPQQLPRARTAPRVMRSKEMMLDFTATEALVFHPNMQNGLPQLLSPLSPPT
ncbi:putative syntaxin binding protein [Trypanosoma cruzi]|uniref:Putative syntaxin binding protein n=1 Tax=Trypanosoma cruzi TaxID=5693 RepID=A0A2V2VMW0_TRYCR|nr:putative syntaxin binding protein [Trypanosoma cruzi]RNC39598.1 putative syntaxin binding protein [Trypanosoma cruzi]